MNDLKKDLQLNRQYKDSIFRLLFNDETKLRELYNDIRGTNYGEDVPIIIRTLQDTIFTDIKNDIAFTIGDKFVVLMEEQSTVCLNMPVRMLSYLGRLYEKMYNRREFYRRSLIKIPVPEFYVFYNGREEMPEEMTLRLSDNYSESAPENSVELVVKMYNIKYNKGAEILEKNKVLYGYSLLISYVEEMKKEGYSDDLAAKNAILRCIEQGVLKDFLQINGTEVTGMLFDYVSKEEFAEIRAEERAEQAALQKQLEIAKAMKDRGTEPDFIAEVTGLSAEQIAEL